MDQGAIEAALDRFFTAIETGDDATVDAMYHADVQVWHSATGRAADKRHSVAILRWLMAPGVTRRYETLEQHVDGQRVSRRHVLHLTIEGHEPMAIDAAIFFTFDDDGLITGIDEYVDSSWNAILAERIPRRTSATD